MHVQYMQWKYKPTVQHQHRSSGLTLVVSGRELLGWGPQGTSTACVQEGGAVHVEHFGIQCLSQGHFKLDTDTVLPP